VLALQRFVLGHQYMYVHSFIRSFVHSIVRSFDWPRSEGQCQSAC